MTPDSRAVVRYALASAVLVAVLGGVLALIFTSAESRRALLIAGVVVAVVQTGAFILARLSSPTNRIAGWGAGAGISLLSLIAFGFVARAQGLPLEPALFGMATFLFATELIEPFFLR